MDDFIFPSFAEPPLLETALSLQFDPLSNFSNAHLGAFWKTIGSEWNQLADAVALEPVFEKFGDERKWQVVFNVSFRSLNGTRLQALDASGSKMVQLQNGRFGVNWLKTPTGDYPRYYAKIKPEFDEMLSRFCIFLKEEGLGEIRPNQWEITYVNHLVKGPLWKSAKDWANLLGGFMPSRDLNSALMLESMGGEWHFEIAPARGRLHVELRHAQGHDEHASELLLLKLTARGPVPEGLGDRPLSDMLDVGHDAIVDTFARLTSPGAQLHWKQQK